MAASKLMVDGADKLYAVWDGKPPRAYGGTADVVAYARGQGTPVRVIYMQGQWEDHGRSALLKLEPGCEVAPILLKSPPDGRGVTRSTPARIPPGEISTGTTLAALLYALTRPAIEKLKPAGKA